MKFLLLTAALVAVAVAGPTQRLAHIGPDFIDQYHPIHVGPEIVDEYHPIHVGPEIVEEDKPISIGPEIIDEYHPISIGPEVVKPPAASASPLVQIIVNVNNNGQVVGAPEAIDVEHPSDIEEIEATPVDVVDVPVKPVDVIELPPAIIGNPVLPIPQPVNLPESLN